MPPRALPDSEPAPSDGRLPPSTHTDRTGRPFGAYVHVPFCRVRCGYCDFNTYAPGELTGPAGAASVYLQALAGEIEMAGAVLQDYHIDSLATVFVGGGTPTLLPPDALVGVLEQLDLQWTIEDGAEVTTEANPDSVTADGLARLRRGGFTRVSLGMQSAVPHVLATLDRTHDPANVAVAVEAARAVGLNVSVDLIYGTPGESLEDWRCSLEAAIRLEPDHISAYALVVEEGTRLAAAVRCGSVARPDDDDEAEKYELADALLGAAAYGWYEISNWARPGKECRHNLGYWRDGDWWGFGPGGHSHVGGVRWWNVKHPGAYADRLASGISPAAAREVLTDEQRAEERLLLGVRLSQGLAVDELGRLGQDAVPGLVDDGLLTDRSPDSTGPRRVVLTLRGRLLADTVVRRLLGLVS